MKVFDVHIHYPWRGPSGELNEKEAIDTLAEQCEKHGIIRACLLGNRRGDTNEATLRAVERYPKLFIPMVNLSPDEDGSAEVTKAHAAGFRGLKLIMPLRNYDDPSYFPLYAECERLNMPILFHCGVLGGPVDFLENHPRDEAVIEERMKFYEERIAGSGRSSARMQPIYLDTLGFTFPKLRIIGAHLGGTGMYEVAFSVARWRRHIHFDISGGTVIRNHTLERRYIGREILPEKLVFGSDSGADRLGSEIQAWQDVFDAIGLSDADRETIFYKNAAKIFGIE